MTTNTTILSVVYKNHDINPMDGTTSVFGSIDQWKEALGRNGHRITDIIGRGQQVYEIHTNKNNMEWCDILINNSEAVYLGYKSLLGDNDRKIQFPTYEDFCKYVFTEADV